MTLIDVFCSDKVARSVLLILILAAFAVFIVNIHPFADDHKWKLSVRIYLVTVASMSEILDLVLYFNGRDPTIKGGVTPCASDFTRTQQAARSGNDATCPTHAACCTDMPCR